jgi:shikimate kinase
MALRIPVLVLTGAVGVGKTAVGAEVSRQLQATETPHLYQDLDALTYTFPRPPADPRGLEIMRTNLAFVWHSAIDRGASRAVLAGCIKNDEEATIIRRAIPGADLCIVQLSAPEHQIAKRLQHREVGLDHDWSIRESIELDRSILAAEFTDTRVVHDTEALKAVASEVLGFWQARIMHAQSLFLA